MKYSLHGLLGEDQRTALFKLWDVIGALTHPVIRPEMVPRIQAALDECLCLVERYLPSHVMVMVLHQLTHLPEYLARYGPVRDYWMFVFEQLMHMHLVTNRVTNNRYPEASAVRAYLVSLCFYQYFTVCI
ncbi:uncharacterized protein LOC144911699 [Branchiostoma floridae x Branchiostoma belcheri]